MEVQRVERGAALAAAMAALGAALLAALALAGAIAADAAEGAAAIGGAALAGVAACGIAVLSRVRLPGLQLLGLATLALLALAIGAAAGAALPSDLALRTVGRAPEWRLPIALAVAALGGTAALSVGMGAPPARASLFLLLPLLALEGLPLGAHPALGLGAAGVALLLSAADGGSRRVRGAVPVALFLLALLLATIFGADPTPGSALLVRLGALAAAFVLIAGDPDAEAAVRTALAAALLTLLLVAACAVVTLLLLHRSVASLGIDVLRTELSLFGRHPNVIAPWFGASAVLALPLALRARGPLRLLALAALPLAAALLALTASRLAVAATLAAGVAAVAAGSRPLWNFARGAVVAALLLALAVAAAPALRHKLLGLLEQRVALAEDHRVHRFRVALLAAAERPVLGHGPLNWFRQGAFAPPSRFAGENSADHPHDVFLAVAVSAGAVGLAAFLALLAGAALLARIALRADDPFRNAAARAAACALLAQLLTSALDAGDALDTLVPSRLLIDLGVLAALARAARPGTGASVGALARAIAGAAAALAAGVLLLAEAAERRAGALALRGDVAGARASLAVAVRLQPWSADLQLQSNGLAFLDGDTRAAKAALDRALELAPDRVDLHEARARMLHALGDARSALNALETATRLDPYGATADRLAPLLAECAYQCGERVRGAKALATAVRRDPMAVKPYLDPARPGALAIGGASVAVTDLLRELAADVPADASLLLRRRVPLRELDVALLAGDLGAAWAALERLDALDGGRGVTGHQFAARIALAARDFEAALAENAAALAIVDAPGLWSDRGDVLAAAGRPDEALAAYRRGFATSEDLFFLEPTFRDLLKRVAETAAAAGRSAERLAALERLAFFVAGERERAGVLLDLAAARTAGGGAGAIDAALGDLRRALRLALRQPLTEDARALARTLGERTAALGRAADDPLEFADDWERAAERAGAGPLVWEFRAALLAGLGLEARARAARALLPPP